MAVIPVKTGIQVLNFSKLFGLQATVLLILLTECPLMFGMTVNDVYYE